MHVQSAYLSTENKDRWDKYRDKVNSMTPEELIREFCSYLNYTEESDNGREFHPVVVSSCRVLLNEPLNLVISKMKEV